MPDEIYGVMAVKNGQKQTIMNLSNARQKSYADLQNMTDAQKKGVIVCPDYPKEEFLVTADEVSYGSGTVKDALDNIKCGQATITANPNTSTEVTVTFTNPYPAGTNYLVQLTQTTNSYAYANLFLGVTQRTVTGFKIQVGSTRSAAQTLNIAWLAVPTGS